MYVRWAHIAAFVLMHFGRHDIRHQRFAHTRPWTRSQRKLQHEIRALQATTECCGNLATRLRVGPLCSTMKLSPLSGWPRWIVDKPTMQVDLVPWQLTSGVGPCMGIVEPFNHVLCVTAQLQILTLELWVPMGTCPGQYGTDITRTAWFTSLIQY